MSNETNLVQCQMGLTCIDQECEACEWICANLLMYICLAPGRMNLGISGWFYGIWGSLLIIILAVVLFYLLKKKRDVWWEKKGQSKLKISHDHVLNVFMITLIV